MKAKVYLVGAGPADPEFLTLKAYRLLEQAEVLIYDRLVSPEIRSLVNPFATLIFAGKSQGQQDEVQSEIYRAFLRYADTVQIIVRLKSGDPSVRLWPLRRRTRIFEFTGHRSRNRAWNIVGLPARHATSFPGGA